MTGLIASEPVREHVRQLRASGASWQGIGAAAGVGTMTVVDLMARRQAVTATTAAALLAVRPADVPQARVAANGATLRLRSLQAMGHSSARVARAAGCHEQTIQRLVRGQARTVSADLHRAIAQVFDAWWDKRPAERTSTDRAAATAARRRAAKHGWCQPAALDEDLLDVPGYVPRAGWRPAMGAGIATDHEFGPGTARPVWRRAAARNKEADMTPAEHDRPQAIEAPLPRPGEPHPDPDLAALGWYGSRDGIYVKDGLAGVADVAALQRYAAKLRPARALEHAMAIQELEP